MGSSEPQPAMRIGHVHLRVANLERAAAFYRDVLGFTSPHTDQTLVCRQHFWPAKTIITMSA